MGFSAGLATERLDARMSAVIDENFPFSERPPREGEPWMPEENLLILAFLG
jgi:hypothetical protein